jgi:exodeoxyribonuclease VII large subunit
MQRELSGRHVLSVSDLNQHSRQLLESAFSAVWVEGEISNFSAPSSGHWYFTLKDAAAQVRCAMFRNRNVRTRLRPAQGMRVVVRAAVSLYVARGDYQLIVEEMEPAGQGDLQRALELLKQKLAAEGLFAAGRKRVLPAYPRHLAVITSATGAALHDILTVLRRRYPALLVSVLPVQVQGEGSAQQIAAAIAFANRVGDQLQPPLDVLLVGRGGGALEDLWSFNEELVARAIHASRLPVVSAVGHETDVTIADLVADVRAATPSAAAELLSPDREALLRALYAARSRLEQLLQRDLDARVRQLDWLRRRLRHPGSRLREQAQRLDELEMRLRSACVNRLRGLESRLLRARNKMLAQSPMIRVSGKELQLVQLRKRLERAAHAALRSRQERLAASAHLLDSVSPLTTLQRGYAIVTEFGGSVLRDAASVAPGTRIEARLAQGSLHCTVDETRP